ncbi:GH25 family lysozyme [Haliangium sp.]|uniref:GH25 family lysozyme n=1 Tax=Haliangium sp. TaxID=2663208 RepID=UPI003D0BC804
MSGEFDQDVATATKNLCLGGSAVEGIDVSYWQGSINWSAVAGDGIDFAIARASVGTTYVDSTFSSNWSGMANAGLIRGAYHYFYGYLDGTAQANHFLAQVGSIGDGDLPLAVDIEYRSDQYSSLSGNDAQDIANLLSLLQTLEAATGRTPMIYTNVATWNELGNPSGFERYPMWAAAWSSCSLQPAQLPDLKVWQYSASGSVSGISGNVDTNLFNGTLAELQAFASDGGSPPPPSSGNMLIREGAGYALNGYSPYNGRELTVWATSSSDPDQRWDLLAPGSFGGNAGWMIRRRGSNYCVNAPSLYDYAPVSLWSCSGGDADQQYDRIDYGSSVLYRRRGSNYCLNGHELSNYGQVTLWPCNTGDIEQRWVIQ